MYDWDPKRYDAEHSYVWKFGSAVVQLLEPKQGEAILDVGCGTGHLTSQIALAGAAVMGVDSSQEMIDEARRAHPDLIFEVADARRLEFVERFDAVFSNAALHWIMEPDMVVAGIARALKTGGRFVAEFGGKGNVQSIRRAMANALKTLGLSQPAPHWYFPSISEYTFLLEKAGLEVTFAVLFDRPTPLEGAGGMRSWIKMYGGHFLGRVPAERQDEFFRLIEAETAPRMFAAGVWTADYRRLRLVARKAPAD